MCGFPFEGTENADKCGIIALQHKGWGLQFKVIQEMLYIKRLRMTM